MLSVDWSLPFVPYPLFFNLLAWFPSPGVSQEPFYFRGVAPATSLLKFTAPVLSMATSGSGVGSGII